MSLFGVRGTLPRWDIFWAISFYLHHQAEIDSDLSQAQGLAGLSPCVVHRYKMHMATKTLTTIEHFAQMQTADTEDYELVEGELIPLSSGTPRHQLIRDLLGYLLLSYLKGNPIGLALAENDCQVAADTVRRPDLSVFLGERSRLIDRASMPFPSRPTLPWRSCRPPKAPLP